MHKKVSVVMDEYIILQLNEQTMITTGRLCAE
jgi:hypothetical protein